MPDMIEHWPAKVLAVAAALLLFLFNRFDSLQTKSFTIPLRLMTDTALVPSKAWTNRIKVTLRGNEEVLSGLTEADFEVMADFSSYQSEGVRREPVQVVRRKSLTETEALEVQVEPQEVTLQLERKVIRTLPIQPDFVGQPGRNFELSGFQVFPSIVTLEGPRSLVEKLTQVNTEPIELRGKTDTFTLKAKVVQETPLISFPYGSTVEVKGIMTSSLATLVLADVAPTAINLNSNLVLQTPLPPVQVKVRGTPQAIATLEAGSATEPSVVLVADLTGFTIPGEIPALPITAQLPEGVELVSLEPATAAVFLEVKP